MNGEIRCVKTNAHAVWEKRKSRLYQFRIGDERRRKLHRKSRAPDESGIIPISDENSIKDSITVICQSLKTLEYLLEILLIKSKV
ncbi:hypothetical protein TNIN_405931 [Trichonephila inaurata madagascariensis]|uniref:Uncharacterized protein n=1 Tax=Trichonephila inaurata madagascariensis TaxID=2747483 RepID=A0A8X7CPK8_9ARAC|nr:hypothetical protein TNIN_405931 [Trichonephila inaurata madagascariensis]